MSTDKKPLEHNQTCGGMITITAKYSTELRMVHLDQTGCPACLADAMSKLLLQDEKFKQVFNHAARMANKKLDDQQLSDPARVN